MSDVPVILLLLSRKQRGIMEKESVSRLPKSVLILIDIIVVPAVAGQVGAVLPMDCVRPLPTPGRRRVGLSVLKPVAVELKHVLFTVRRVPEVLSAIVIVQAPNQTRAEAVILILVAEVAAVAVAVVL